MNKRLCVLLVLVCLVLSGCGLLGERIKEPVTFYYVRQDFQYFTESDVIVPEVREAAGHREELSYLLALYFMGPTEEGLRSFLPRGTAVQSIDFSEQGLTLQLTNLDLSLTDTQFSLACACLSLTCMDLTDAAQVTIISGERTITMSRDSLVLMDSSVTIKEETQ